MILMTGSLMIMILVIKILVIMILSIESQESQSDSQAVPFSGYCSHPVCPEV